MGNEQKTDLYSEEEAQRRLEAALRGARVAGHKPMSARKRDGNAVPAASDAVNPPTHPSRDGKGGS